MQVFERLGVKPRDTFDPVQNMQLKTALNKVDTMRALNHEMFVLTQAFDSRLNDLARSRDREYLKNNPQFSPMPAGYWEREYQAIRRINELTGELL